MFESTSKLAEDVRRLVRVIRGMSDGAYACLLDRRSVLVEDPEPEDPRTAALQRRLRTRGAELLALPAGMESGAPFEDVFEDFDDHEFLVAVVNGRVALAVACPSAEEARARVDEPLRLLVDRLLRMDERYRIDTKGRGLFVGRPRLDVVCVGRAGAT